MDTPIEEFVTLPYLSHSACSSVEFDGKTYLVLRLALSPPDLPGEDPDDVSFVKFVLGLEDAQKLSRGLANGILGIPTIY